MTDQELEQLLARHRLAGPRSALRARVLQTTTGNARQVRLGLFDYALTGLAAALIVAAIVLDGTTGPASIEAAREREIADVARALGGGPEAMRYAELVVSRDAELVDPAFTEASW